jgi:hypothetical protein
LHPRLTFTSQILFYFLSAIASGFWFVRWRRLCGEDKEGLWSLYGYFTGFTCAASCVGVATWTTFLFVFSYNFETNDTDAIVQRFQSLRTNSRLENEEALSQVNRVLSFMGSSQTHWAAWQILNSFEFSFFCIAKLTVLDRLKDFSSYQAKFAVAGRVVAVLIIASCIVCVCGSVVSSVNRAQSAAFAFQAEAVFINLTSTERSQIPIIQAIFPRLHAPRIYYVHSRAIVIPFSGEHTFEIELNQSDSVQNFRCEQN